MGYVIRDEAVYYVSSLTFDMEITAGIHKVERIRGANVFLVLDSGGSAAVVDSGMPGNEGRIVEYARSVGVNARMLEYIVLTHSDIDHSGSTARLKQITGAKVAIHQADAPRVAGEKKLKDVKGGMGVLFGIMGKFMRFTPVKPDILLKDSDKILDMTVIHTPGHTDGSVCLYRENQAMFVGDALRTDSDSSPRLPPGAMTLNMEQAKESVKKISTYQYSFLFPGHGPPMVRNASQVMKAFVQNGFAVS